LFVGVYQIGAGRRISSETYWRKRANRRLHRLGMRGLQRGRRSCWWFDLDLTDVLAEWKGKLMVGWTGERTWYRWAAKNVFPVRAVLEESALVPDERPDSEQLVLTWDQLSALPRSLREALSQWRGVYLIYDANKKKGYVGSAYGTENLYQRWTDYARTGHGGNKQLRRCRPQDLRFSILELVAPKMTPEDVIRLESTWKERLHTREFGLNEN
jgi:hypothetical protein